MTTVRSSCEQNTMALPSNLPLSWQRRAGLDTLQSVASDSAVTLLCWPSAVSPLWRHQASLERTQHQSVPVGCPASTAPLEASSLAGTDACLLRTSGKVSLHVHGPVDEESALMRCPQRLTWRHEANVVPHPGQGAAQQAGPLPVQCARRDSHSRRARRHQRLLFATCFARNAAAHVMAARRPVLLISRYSSICLHVSRPDVRRKCSSPMLATSSGWTT